MYHTADETSVARLFVWSLVVSYTGELRPKSCMMRRQLTWELVCAYTIWSIQSINRSHYSRLAKGPPKLWVLQADWPTILLPVGRDRTVIWMMLVSFVLNIYRVMLNYKIFDNLHEWWGILHRKSCTFHEGASKLSVCVFSTVSENLIYISFVRDSCIHTYLFAACSNAI